MMLEKGLNDDTLTALKAMMNPTVVGLLEATGGDLRQMIIEKVTPSLTASLQQNVGEVEVFQQTRSIVSSVRRLYEVGSPVPATLILLFSVVVPFVKMALVGWAMFVVRLRRSGDARWRSWKRSPNGRWPTSSSSRCSSPISPRWRVRARRSPVRRSSPSRRSSGPASTGSPPTACSRWRPSSSPRACSPRAC